MLVGAVVGRSLDRSPLLSLAREITRPRILAQIEVRVRLPPSHIKDKDAYQMKPSFTTSSVCREGTYPSTKLSTSPIIYKGFLPTSHTAAV